MRRLDLYFRRLSPLLCVLLLGAAAIIIAASGGNPYGTSWPAGFPSILPDETALACARFQGARLARFTTLLAG